MHICYEIRSVIRNEFSPRKRAHWSTPIPSMSVSEQMSSQSERLARFQELKNRREEATAANLASAKQEDAELRVDPRDRLIC